MSLLAVSDDLPRLFRKLYAAGEVLAKEAGDAKPSYALSGLLYLSDSGYLLLSVPNALVRGVFAAMHEHGVELPLRDGKLEAHISVMRPEEIAALGGPEKLTERGKRYRYRLGGLVTAAPAGWPEMAKVWMLRVYSPELQALRKSYGLSPLPNNNQYDFHCTVAVRRKGVLGRNETSKATAPPSAD